MKKLISIFLITVMLASLAACGDSAPSSSSQAQASSESVSRPEDAPPAEFLPQEASSEEPSAPPPGNGDQEDNTAPEPDEVQAENESESKDWKRLTEYRREILDEEKADLIAVTTTTGTVEVDELVISQDEFDAIPNEDELPASFVGFITRYDNCTLRVQSVLTKDGGLYFPTNRSADDLILGETVFEKSGISGAYGLTIPYLSEPDAEHYGEAKTGCRYAVTFEWDGGNAVYYPAGAYYHNTLSSPNVKYYYMPDATKSTSKAKNNPNEETKTSSVTQTAEYEELPRDVVLPNAKIMPAQLNEAEREAFVVSVDAEEIKQYIKEKGIGINREPWYDVEIDSVKSLDGVGYLVSLKDGDSSANRAVALYSSDKRLIDVTTNYETYNDDQQQGVWPMVDGRGWLVGSGKSLFFIAVHEGVPRLIRQTTWLALEIKDPADPAASLYFGATFLAYPYSSGRPQADSDIFFAVQRRGDNLTALLYTKAVLGSANYSFQDLMQEVIATPEMELSPAQPYEASFDRNNNLVRVVFPTSCSVLDFDFNSYSIAYHTSYTKELLEQEDSQMLDSTYDGRFQLWQVNVRYEHESTWSSYVVYDTHTGYIQDFDAVGQFIHPTFVDDRTVAVYYYEDSSGDSQRSDPDFAEIMKASVRQRIVLYNLFTGQKREPELDLSEFGWSEVIHGYAWDADTRQHIVLSTSMYQNPALPFKSRDNQSHSYDEYCISYFSSDGALQRIYPTGANRFQGRFVYYLPGFRSLGGGRATLYRTGGGSGYGADSYAFDPETGKLEDYFNVIREKQLISYEISQWAQEGKPDSVSRVVSDYVDDWVEQPEGAGVFAHFIEQLQKTPCWVTNYYSPETGILVADDIYNLKFYWLSEDGQSIVTDMITNEKSMWDYLYKPLYVQDSENNWYCVYLADERLSIYLWDDTAKLLYYIPEHMYSPIIPRGINIYIGATADADIGLQLNEELYPHSGLRWENGGITIYSEEKDLLRVYIEADSIRCVAV